MNYVVAIFISAGGASVIGAIIGALATFRVNRASSVKLLVESQQIAQKTALESAAESYTMLHRDYERCNIRLDDVRRTLEPLIEAVDAMISRMAAVNGRDEVTVTVTPGEIATVRGALREARRHLN